MRRIALINQKGGVGKTTTTVNLGAALALAGKRVVVVDLDPQANLTLYLGLELGAGAPSSYRVLTGEVPFAAALRDTSTPNLRVLPTDIHLSGAELELSAAEGREGLLRAAIETWRAEHARAHRGEEPADYVLFDCPPSLGLLSLNALAAADEVFLVVQTQFLALQGLSRLVEVIELVQRGLHPGLRLAGIVPCMYDSRMRLAREVLAELRRYFPSQVFRTPISANVKLAESPSFGKTIFEYAPDSIGARDFASLSHEVLTQAVLPRPEARPTTPPAPAATKEPANARKPARATEAGAASASPAPAAKAPTVARPAAGTPTTPRKTPAKEAAATPSSPGAKAPAPGDARGVSKGERRDTIVPSTAAPKPASNGAAPRATKPAATPAAAMTPAVARTPAATTTPPAPSTPSAAPAPVERVSPRRTRAPAAPIVPAAPADVAVTPAAESGVQSASAPPSRRGGGARKQAGS